MNFKDAIKLKKLNFFIINDNHCRNQLNRSLKRCLYKKIDLKTYKSRNQLFIYDNLRVQCQLFQLKHFSIETNSNLNANLKTNHNTNLETNSNQNETSEVIASLKESYTKNGVVTQLKQTRIFQFFESYFKDGLNPSFKDLATFSLEVELNFRQIYSIMNNMPKYPIQTQFHPSNNNSNNNSNSNINSNNNSNSNHFNNLIHNEEFPSQNNTITLNETQINNFYPISNDSIDSSTFQNMSNNLNVIHTSKNSTFATLYPIIEQANGKITHHVKQIVRNWLKSTNYAAPNENERLYLSQICGISLLQLRGLLRRLRDPKGKLTHRAKAIVLNWFIKNERRMPNKNEIMELRELSGLNYFQLREQFRIFKTIHGILTHEKKQIFPQILKDSNFELIPPNRLHTLAQRLKLSPNQVYRQLYLLKNASTKQVSQEHKVIISEIMSRYPTEGCREMYDEMQEKTGLSRSQLHAQVRILKEANGTMTSESKSIIREWILKNDFKTPNDEERDYLMKSSRLSSSQLSELIFRLREENGQITPEKQIILQNWITLHERQPHQKEIKQLSEELSLSRKQIYYLTQKILNPPGKITEESKEIVKRWLIMNDNKKPTEEEKRDLLSKTGWNSEQLSNQLRRIRIQLELLYSKN